MSVLRWYRDRCGGARPGAGGLARATAAAALVGLCAGARAADEYSIDSPRVVKGENEVEAQSYAAHDGASGLGGDRQYRLSAARGLTDNWALEVYNVLAKPPGGDLRSQQVEVENRFQLTPMGEYWANFGLVQGAEIPLQSGAPYELELMPIIEKQWGRKLITANLMFERSFGTNHEHGLIFNYRMRAEYLYNRFIAPAVEFYGEPGPLGNFLALHEQRQELGPALYGAAYFNNGRTLYYSTAVLFGLTAASADVRWIFRAEYEFFD